MAAANEGAIVVLSVLTVTYPDVFFCISAQRRFSNMHRQVAVKTGKTFAPSGLIGYFLEASGG